MAGTGDGHRHRAASRSEQARQAELPGQGVDGLLELEAQVGDLWQHALRRRSARGRCEGATEEGHAYREGENPVQLGATHLIAPSAANRAA